MKYIFNHKQKFDEYSKELNKVPNYKKIINSMVNFDDMYQLGGSFDVRRITELLFLTDERQYKRSLIYNTNKDLIKTFDEKGNVRLVLSSSGKKVFFKEYPIYKIRRKGWDKNWTVIMYDIPLKNNSLRKAFRRKLLSFGFGNIQRSIMLTPLPLQDEIKEYIKNKKIEKYMLVFSAKNILGLSNEEIAKQAFNIEELNMLYSELLRVSKTKKFIENYKIWIKYYLAVLNKDPHLPYELLTQNWKGDECKEVYKKLLTNRIK